MSSSSSRDPLAASFPAEASSGRAIGTSVRRRAAALDLATVAPRDECAEHDRQDTEAGGEERRTPCNGGEHGDAAQHHETDAHHGNGAHGEHATRHDACAVEEQPARRQQAEQTETREVEREHDTNRDGWCEAEHELAERREDDRLARAPALPDAGCDTDHHRQRGGGEPFAEPRGSWLDRAAGESGDQGDDADGDLPPSGDTGERGGALHGAADEAEVVERAGMEGGGGHDYTMGRIAAIYKYFARQRSFSAVLNGTQPCSGRGRHDPPRPAARSCPRCDQRSLSRSS